jgi:hypothetical protein
LILRKKGDFLAKIWGSVAFLAIFRPHPPKKNKRRWTGQYQPSQFPNYLQKVQE